MLTSGIAAIGLMMILTPASPALASPNTGADLGVTASCQASTNYPDEPPGRCIAIRSNAFRDNLAGAAPSICQFAQQEEPDYFYYYYASYEDCVQDQAYFILN
jgi:hypothetical protein